MRNIGVDECDVCNRDGCDGVMWLPPVRDCSCHISPPCSQCENNCVVCNECGADPFDDDGVTDRCTTCGMALDDDGTCGDCLFVPEAQKRNDAMERGDELRDRAKDERAERKRRC